MLKCFQILESFAEIKLTNSRNKFVNEDFSR